MLPPTRITRFVGLLALLPAVGRGEEGYFDSAGVQLHYSVDGVAAEAERPAVLLIHGYAGDAKRAWSDSGVIDALVGAGYRVVAYDQRGHGRSDRPHTPDAYGMPMVEDARRLLDHLGVERAHVVGFSMGAAVANKLRDAHPDRLLSVTLAGYGEPPLPEEHTADLVREIETNLRNMGLLGSNDPKALGLLSVGWKAWRLDDAALRRNETPALALSGEEDPFLNDARRLAEVMAGLRLVTQPGDHGATTSCPEFVVELKRFLAANDE